MFFFLSALLCSCLPLRVAMIVWSGDEHLPQGVFDEAIPGSFLVVQWVKGPALSLLQLCCFCGVGLIPGLGISSCCGCSQKKKTKQTNKQKTPKMPPKQTLCKDLSASSLVGGTSRGVGK